MAKRKRLDIKWYAGVEDVITYDIPGDHSQREHSFAIKADKAKTSDRLIEKTSAAGQISAVYDTTTLQTTITITLLEEDTFDLAGGTYYWDQRSVSATDVNDSKVPIYGNFNIEAAVQTPFDGYPLPGDPSLRYQVLSASDGEDGDIVLTKLDADGNLVFDFSTVAKLYGFSIEAADGEEGDLIQIKSLNGQLLFDFVSLVNLKLQLGL